MNGRHFYISHFFFYILHLTNKSGSNEYKIKTLSIQNSNATPYGRPSITKNALNEDGARGRTAVLERSEFAVLAFFWFLFWGNAKKGTKTIHND